MSRPILALAAAIAVALSGAALAATSHPVVRAAKNAALHKTVVVDAHGRTLYSLSSESAKHLRCTTSKCVGNWPPLTVRSRKVHLHAGHGVHGRLATVRRPDGAIQVTLRGRPLYRFAGDARKGDAHGQGIKALGGTWHAVTASAARQKKQPSSAPASQPQPEPAPSPYPSGY